MNRRELLKFQKINSAILTDMTKLNQFINISIGTNNNKFAYHFSMLKLKIGQLKNKAKKKILKPADIKEMDDFIEKFLIDFLFMIGGNK